MPAPQELGIWPENWQAFRVFYRLRTQWASGMGGAIGLRYETLPFALRLEQVARADWPEVTDGLQIMEHETLRLLAEKKG